MLPCAVPVCLYTLSFHMSVSNVDFTNASCTKLTVQGRICWSSKTCICSSGSFVLICLRVCVCVNQMFSVCMFQAVFPDQCAPWNWFWLIAVLTVGMRAIIGFSSWAAGSRISHYEKDSSHFYVIFSEIWQKKKIKNAPLCTVMINFSLLDGLCFCADAP